MSSSRPMTSQALPAWNVVSARWPVSEAWRAISAVARSRISPMAMTSGSWRSSDAQPDLEGQPGRRVDLRLGDARRRPTSIGSSSVARLRWPRVGPTSSRRQA